VLTGEAEYLVVHRPRLDLGVAVDGSIAFSSWDLGSPPGGVTDSQGYVYYPDDVHIYAEWWAVDASLKAHVHLTRFLTLDGAIGYGPYGYFNVNYADDVGVTYGPVEQSSEVFPTDAWGIDWTAGLSFGFFRWVDLSVDLGMRGPDFVTGLGLSFPM